MKEAEIFVVFLQLYDSFTWFDLKACNLKADREEDNSFKENDHPFSHQFINYSAFQFYFL